MNITSKIIATRLATYKTKDNIEKQFVILSLKRHYQTICVRIYGWQGRLFLNKNIKYTQLSIKSPIQKDKYLMATLDSVQWIKDKNKQLVYKRQNKQVQVLRDIPQQEIGHKTESAIPVEGDTLLLRGIKVLGSCFLWLLATSR